MCLSARLPEGQNVTGIPTMKSCPKVGDTGFPQAGAYLVDKSPGGEKSETHTHTGTVSTAVSCGAVRNCRKPMEEDAKKKKNEKGKAGREEAVFFLKLGCPCKQSKITKETHG